VGTVGKIISDIWNNHDKNSIEKEKVKKEIELEKTKFELELLLQKKKKEEEEKIEKEKKEKERMIEGNKEWNNERDKIIDSILKNIKYLDIIMKLFNENIKDSKKNFEEKIIVILKNNNEQYKSLIRKKHKLIFNDIKSKIPKVETLNYIILGQFGIGKSCLVNGLLEKELAKESSGIVSETQKFTRYENPTDVPGIALYDTIGVEPSSKNRNIKEIKELVQKTFEDNLQDPNKSLHGIIFCINSGSSCNRIEDSEINFIKELNGIYGNSNILTMAFTRALSSTSTQIKERIKELQEKLNNKEIEIIPVNSKYKLQQICDQKIPVPQFGLIELKEAMLKNSKKIIMAHLKYSTKKVMIEYYKTSTKEIFNAIENKLNNNEFENSFIKEAENIIKKLFDETMINFSDINIDFSNLEKDITGQIESMNEKVKNILIEKYEDKGIIKLNDAFNSLNSKYDNKLNDSNSKENFNNKFEEFCENEVTNKISKVIIGEFLKIFLNKSFEIISELISDNISEEDLEGLANTNIDNLLAKINKKDNKENSIKK